MLVLTKTSEKEQSLHSVHCSEFWFFEKERQTRAQVRQGLSRLCFDVRGLVVLSWEEDADKDYNTLSRRRIFFN